VTPGGNIAAMVAFNVENGNVVWETPSLNEGSQYVNPLLIETKGMKVIITHTPTWIIGVNAANGKILWKFNFGSVNDDQGVVKTTFTHQFIRIASFLPPMVTGRLQQRSRLTGTERIRNWYGKIRKSIRM